MERTSPNIIAHCPVCDQTHFQDYLELQDYFLSKELFVLIKCLGCGLLFTHPKPEIGLITKYYLSKDYTSHNTSINSLKNLLYKLARNISLRRKLRMIENHSGQGTLLDIGAGTGDFLNTCHKKGWNVYGVEPNNRARKLAFHEHGLDLYENLQESTFKKGSLDVVTMWHVLEHLENPLEQLKLNYKLLKPDGLMVVALPNYESWDADYYGKYWAAYDVPRHLFHFSKQSIIKLSEKAGFETADIKPMKLDAYYISLLSEKYACGKMNYLKAFLNGWRSNAVAKSGKMGYSSWAYFFLKK